MVSISNCSFASKELELGEVSTFTDFPFCFSVTNGNTEPVQFFVKPTCGCTTATSLVFAGAGQTVDLPVVFKNPGKKDKFRRKVIVELIGVPNSQVDLFFNLKYI